ncbi:sensor histidine kinase [Chryseobacterium camelliae]|uniref:sensor histidine kinase n=1 Tax=Chryseobacterium camelliae TaxID=1265445 RepID=UPI002854DB1E|nr:histidine kinase [Chryseobacterium camelliae]MDR6516873.1 LytS/YehU family sensor histidine kinase [Chryseobacterium camelliae]
MFIPAWINNFLLLPRLNQNKNVKNYLVAVIILFLLSAVILGRYLKYLYDHFSNSELVDFTPIAVSASSPGIPQQYQCYFEVFPGIVITMFMMAAGYSVQRFLLKIKQEEQAKAQHAIAQLHLLRSQISPHYLFNVLNSLYALSLKRSEETPDVILKLSDILRYSLYETQEKEIAVSHEIHILKMYIDIEKLRMPENASISFRHSVKESGKIAPMLLLPLIENAFKHGIDSNIEASYINASLMYDHQGLLFTCENNFKELPDKKIGGIGIENIRKRLEILYPFHHQLEIKKDKDIFNITLKINF